MFSLIITIISIALVAALALATLYYGGAAFNKGSAGAQAARLINEGQQINGAIQVLKADQAANSVVGGVVPTDIAGLAPNYMSQVPTKWDATTLLSVGTVLTADVVSQEVCDEVNKRAGIGTKLDGEGEVVAEEVTAATASIYGCVTAAADAANLKVFYKF